jgi:hypothetical protein
MTLSVAGIKALALLCCPAMKGRNVSQQCHGSRLIERQTDQPE